MSTEFKRKKRYLVFKLSDVEEHFTPGEKQQLARLAGVQRVGRSEAGKPPLEYVVVESDWPEYEPTWKAIEVRVTGAQPAPSASEDGLPERDSARPAEQQGLFRKFIVRRTDGSDAPGGKHYGCRYFALDVDHDKHAVAALTAYAKACETTHPELAKDLREKWGAHPAPSVPEGWQAGVEAVAAMLQKKADDYAEEYGYDDRGGLSFGGGMGGEAKMDYYNNLIELIEEIRAMLAAAPEAKP